MCNVHSSKIYGVTFLWATDVRFWYNKTILIICYFEFLFSLELEEVLIDSSLDFLRDFLTDYLLRVIFVPHSGVFHRDVYQTQVASMPVHILTRSIQNQLRKSAKQVTFLRNDLTHSLILIVCTTYCNKSKWFVRSLSKRTSNKQSLDTNSNAIWSTTAAILWFYWKRKRWWQRVLKCAVDVLEISNRRSRNWCVFKF